MIENVDGKGMIFDKIIQRGEKILAPFFVWACSNCNVRKARGCVKKTEEIRNIFVEKRHGNSCESCYNRLNSKEKGEI